MVLTRLAWFTVLSLVTQGLAISGVYGPESAVMLSSRADLIVLGVTSSQQKINGLNFVDIEIQRVLKGTQRGGAIHAAFEESPLMRTNQDGGLATGTGLWLLRVDGADEYHIIPLAAGDYTFEDAFLPLSIGDWPRGDGLPSQLVFEAVTNWYRNLRSPTYLQDSRLFKEASAATSAEVQTLIQNFTSSPFPNLNAIGRALALQFGTPQAVVPLIGELSRIRLTPGFKHVLGALSLQFTPTDGESLASLTALALAYPDVSGLSDAIAASAIRKGGKDVLPLMAALLSGADRQARLRAATFFGDFALFADAKGNISGTHLLGPWATDAVKAMRPRTDSTYTVEDYSRFWLGWWAQNQAALGFENAQ